MKVAVNVKTLKSGHLGRGIGFYTENLIQSLSQFNDIQVTTFDNESELSNIDIVHYPTFDLFSTTLPIFKKFSTIVTIHDVIPLIFKKHYPVGVKGSINFFIQKIALQNVKAIITDSVSSQNDISKYLAINKNKIIPISLAPSNLFKVIKDQKRLQRTKEKFNLPDKFVLYIGDVNWNKNLVNAAQSCIGLGINLVLIGKGFMQDTSNHPELRIYQEFVTEFSNNPLIHILGFVSTQEIVDILNLAEALLFVSFYEGFGLPILEAQACGTPVITSNVSSMPEVAGEGAIKVDPYSLSEIKEAVNSIYNNKKLRNDLVEKGFENIKHFSWQKTALKTIQVYKDVINRR